MSRAEHLVWAKARALAYCEAGELGSAVASLFSDLAKHERGIARDQLKAGLEATLSCDAAQVRAWIEGLA